MSGFNKNISVKILDLKIHNLFSIYHFMKEQGFKVRILEREDKITNSDVFLIPGVGSFDMAMKVLKKFNLDRKIIDYYNKDKFIFAICLGMQLLFENSFEFKKTRGLGIIKGKVKYFPKNRNLLVPHVGWNKISFKKEISKFKDVDNKDFYFIHSLLCDPVEKNSVLTNTTYGDLSFCSSIFTKNLYATQFHPEKSGAAGIKLINQMRNFI